MSVPAPALPLWDDVKTPENPTLTPFLLPGERIRPALVVCPGGAFIERAAHEGAPLARWVNSLGLHAFVCDYRVAPSRHPAALDDAQRALRLIRHRAAEWRVDPGRLGLMGFSAGGHLVCAAGNLGEDGDAASPDPLARHSGRPDAVIAGYPLISNGPFGHPGAFRNLVGDAPDPQQVQLLSLETSVTARNPPTFLWSTAEDLKVPVENSLLYAAALRQHRVPFALHIYPHGPHGLGLAAENAVVSDWTHRCAAWLAALGWCG